MRCRALPELERGAWVSSGSLQTARVSSGSMFVLALPQRESTTPPSSGVWASVGGAPSRGATASTRMACERELASFMLVAPVAPSNMAVAVE